MLFPLLKYPNKCDVVRKKVEAECFQYLDTVVRTFKAVYMEFGARLVLMVPHKFSRCWSESTGNTGQLVSRKTGKCPQIMWVTKILPKPER